MFFKLTFFFFCNSFTFPILPFLLLNFRFHKMFIVLVDAVAEHRKGTLWVLTNANRC